MLTMIELTEELNRRAKYHPIGRLQEIRREIKKFLHPPSHQLFTARTTKEQYAFHHGGRRELQFNIGFEIINGKECLRHGVAFSLETSQTLPDIEPLESLILRFNDFIINHPEEFMDFKMWHDIGGIHIGNYYPGPILPDIVAPGTFIFFGKFRPIADLDYEIILTDFDRLLPLYQYVQGDDLFPTLAKPGGSLQFLPGCSIKSSQTQATRTESVLDIQLRHNELERALHQYLEEQYGKDDVGTEIITGIGTRVDVVVRRGERYWYYEIKTALSARACIREALAQLLEYSFWPGAQEAERLIIIGEARLDSDARSFLTQLRERFSLPIYYQQFDMKKNLLNE